MILFDHQNFVLSFCFIFTIPECPWWIIFSILLPSIDGINILVRLFDQFNKWNNLIKCNKFNKFTFFPSILLIRICIQNFTNISNTGSLSDSLCIYSIEIEFGIVFLETQLPSSNDFRSSVSTSRTNQDVAAMLVPWLNSNIPDL